MKVLIYEESYYDSHGIQFVSSTVENALKTLVKQQKDQVLMHENLIEGLNRNNAYFERHFAIHSLNLQTEEMKLKQLEEYISSKQWTDENIEDFIFEPHHYFSWYEVDQ